MLLSECVFFCIDGMLAYVDRFVTIVQKGTNLKLSKDLYKPSNLCSHRLQLLWSRRNQLSRRSLVGTLTFAWVVGVAAKVWLDSMSSKSLISVALAKPLGSRVCAVQKQPIEIPTAEDGELVGLTPLSMFKFKLGIPKWFVWF
jgi:hypothetical protein